MHWSTSLDAIVVMRAASIHRIDQLLGMSRKGMLLELSGIALVASATHGRLKALG